MLSYSKPVDTIRSLACLKVMNTFALGGLKQVPSVPLESLRPQRADKDAVTSQVLL